MSQQELWGVTDRCQLLSTLCVSNNLIIRNGKSLQRITNSLWKIMRFFEKLSKDKADILKMCWHLLWKIHIWLSEMFVSKKRLTSLPTRSSWFSTMPHGAIPMVQIFPLDLEAWSFRASPTWRITPLWETIHKDALFHSLYWNKFKKLNERKLKQNNLVWIQRHPHKSRSQVVVLGGTAVKPRGHLITFLQLTSPLSLPTVPPIQASIYYSGLSLSLSRLCTHSVTKSYFPFLSVFKCGLTTTFSTVSFISFCSFVHYRPLESNLISIFKSANLLF